MPTKKTDKEVVIYQAKSGAIELRVDSDAETIWATQAEIALLFDVNPQAITKHLKNIYTEKELDKNATCSKKEQVQKEGKRQVKRTVQVYNLDAIISVGYRINSKTGTKFRQWATHTLKAHIADGYTINKKRIAQNYENFLNAVAGVKALLPAGETVNTEDVLELINAFAGVWLSLDAYDTETLPKEGATKKDITITAESN